MCDKLSYIDYRILSFEFYVFSPNRNTTYIVGTRFPSRPPASSRTFIPKAFDICLVLYRSEMRFILSALETHPYTIKSPKDKKTNYRITHLRWVDFVCRDVDVKRWIGIDFVSLNRVQGPVQRGMCWLYGATQSWLRAIHRWISVFLIREPWVNGSMFSPCNCDQSAKQALSIKFEHQPPMNFGPSAICFKLDA